MSKNITNRDLYSALEAIDEKMDKTYVRKDVYRADLKSIDKSIRPLKTFMYAFVGAVLMSVLGALLATVISSGSLALL